jgi:hypothetical protein
MNVMRLIAIPIFVLALAASALAGAETVDELKARLASARPDDQPGLCLRIAQEQLRAADKFYNDGNVEQARASLNDIVTYAQKARDAAVGSRKHLKNVEIEVRKMSEKLSDIKRTLAFEDQPPVAEAIRQLEDIRTSLLNEMFKKDKK